MSISKDTEKTENLKEVIARPNGHLWKMSGISEVKSFCQERPGFRQKESM